MLSRFNILALLLFVIVALLAQASLALGWSITEWDIPGTSAPEPRQFIKDGSDIWLVDDPNDNLLKFDTVTDTFTASYNMPGPTRRPQGVAMDASGHIWTTGIWSSDILEFDPNTTTFTAYSIAPMMAGYLITKDTTGNLWFVGHTTDTPDWDDHAIGRFDPVTKAFTSWTNPGGRMIDHGFLASDGKFYYNGWTNEDPGFGVFDPVAETWAEISSDQWSPTIQEGNDIWLTSPDNKVATYNLISETITAEYPLPSMPAGIMEKDSDGLFWNSLWLANNLYSFDPASVDGIFEYPVPTPNAKPQYVLPDGNSVWFIERQAGKFARLDLDQGSWEQVGTNGFGDQTNTDLMPLTEFNGYLYAGTWNEAGSGGEIWRSADGETWESVMTGGFGDPSNTGTWPTAVFDGYLYAGSEDNTVSGARIWRTSNGTTWTAASAPGFGDSNNSGLAVPRVFGSHLYVGTAGSTASQVWRSANGTDWSAVSDPGFGDLSQTSARIGISFNDSLFVGSGSSTGRVFSSANGTSWSQAGPDGLDGNPENVNVLPYAAFNDYLYARVTNSGGTGGRVFRTADGNSWAQVSSDGFGDPDNGYIKLANTSFNGYLYASTYNSNDGAQVWRTANGTDWNQVNANGFGDRDNTKAHQPIFYNGRVYVGTRNAADGGEIWAYSFDNTPLGSNVATELATGIEIEFAEVTGGGSTVVEVVEEAPAAEPTGFSLLGQIYDITTNAETSGTITVTLSYDEGDVAGDEADIKMYHWNGSSWDDITISVDTGANTVTGESSSLSEFILVTPLTSPPTGVNHRLLVLAALMTIGMGIAIVSSKRLGKRQHI